MKRIFIVLLLSAMLAFPMGGKAAEEIILPLRPLFQQDYKQYVYSVGGEDRTVATSGCSVVCLSMALQILRPALSQTPETLFQQACETGEYQGEGLSVQQLRTLSETYGVQLVSVNGTSSAIQRALSEGGPVLVATGDGPVFAKGHYLLLYGMDSAERFHIADPGSASLSGRTFLWNDLFSDDPVSDRFFAFRSANELENMAFRVNLLTQRKLRQSRDAR